ncbi:gamma-tubulin complex component 3 isoform X2 [Halyomorpha halys]|nr:gamma-tubulin complex component 3 isoform X2 [Halyomorpha halys]
MGAFVTFQCKESGERARFTCTDRGRLTQQNVFQDILNFIQGEDFHKNRNEDQFMKGDVFTTEKKYQNIQEQKIYNETMKFCTIYKNSHILLESQNQCMAAEGMVNHIRGILQDYYKIVAELNSESNLSTDSEARDISLRSALVWSRKSVIVLQHITYILENTKHQQGSLILNPLIKLLPLGNPELRNITMQIFEGAAEAFCKMIWLWLIMGILNDPYGEFFVTENETISKPSTWNTRYCLRVEAIPTSLPINIAKLIMDAGKMLNFLQNICGETVPFTNARLHISNLQQEKHCGLLPLITGDGELNCQMHRIFEEYGRMVLIVMNEKFSLIEYFHGVYWYIFLKLSNFGRFFIELIHPLLHLPIEKLRIDCLRRKLKRAVIATSPYNRKKRRLQETRCITADWYISTPTDKLSDVLQINYDPGGPLKSIFYIYETSYQKMFAFLWRKQHIQFSLCNQRKILLYIMKKVNLDEKTNDCWRTLFWFVSVMMQFIYQLDYYFMYEIIEKEWNHFWKILNDAKCINEVTHVYGKMLDNILNGTMQTEENKEAKVFQNFFYTLVIDVEKIVENMEKKLLRTNGHTDNPMKTIAEIKIFQNNFADGVKEFMNLISSFSHNDALIALSDRINFNYYYKKIEG